MRMIVAKVSELMSIHQVEFILDNTKTINHMGKEDMFSKELMMVMSTKAITLMV